MRRIIMTVLMIIGMVLGTAAAISAVGVNHQHLDGSTIDHAAPLDGDGCHEGPGGYHCH